ncbi:MAG: hypothetical protein WBI07_11440, partial [Mobilitalea sp.]
MQTMEVITTICPASSPSASISIAIEKEETAVGEAARAIKATSASFRNPNKTAIENMMAGTRINLPITAMEIYLAFTQSRSNWKVPPSTIKASGVAIFDKLCSGERRRPGSDIRSDISINAKNAAIMSGFLSIPRRTTFLFTFPPRYTSRIMT